MQRITASNGLKGMQGAGMQLRFDADTLRTLSTMRPGDTFSVKYSLHLEDGGTMKAELSVRLDDPSGLFAGHSIVAVLGNLLQQMVEARLS